MRESKREKDKEKEIERDRERVIDRERAGEKDKKNYLTGDESKESFVVFTEATETDVFTLKTIIYIKL